MDRSSEAAEFFNLTDGSLKNITELKYWGLQEVLVHRYGLEVNEATYLVDFLLPMLEIEPQKRAAARQMISHPWLLLSEEPSEPIPEEVRCFVSDSTNSVQVCHASAAAREFSRRQHPDLANASPKLDSSAAGSSVSSRPTSSAAAASNGE